MLCGWGKIHRRSRHWVAHRTNSCKVWSWLRGTLTNLLKSRNAAGILIRFCGEKGNPFPRCFSDWLMKKDWRIRKHIKEQMSTEDCSPKLEAAKSICRAKKQQSHFALPCSLICRKRRNCWERPDIRCQRPQGLTWLLCIWFRIRNIISNLPILFWMITGRELFQNKMSP